MAPLLPRICRSVGNMGLKDGGVKGELRGGQGGGRESREASVCFWECCFLIGIDWKWKYLFCKLTFVWLTRLSLGIQSSIRSTNWMFSFPWMKMFDWNQNAILFWKETTRMISSNLLKQKQFKSAFANCILETLVAIISIWIYEHWSS